DFLSSVRETTLLGYSHQSYPFDRLVEDLDIVRDLSRHPVFDVMVSFQESVSGDNASNSVVLDGLIVEPYNGSGYAVSKFDLDFSFSENASGLSIGLGYNTDIYDISFVERLLNSLELLLVSIGHTPELTINKLDVLGSEDH
ncbi:condensation domain-containing protein, partial [Chryseobacterium sp. NRRL B-14859]|uniref:condensation domain-containing protein n=1 Tax=Chryseobacterium sp. NRRL B-14859 TaxID=1562763 RepID=UPI003394782E